MNNELVADYAGNQYPASALNEQETPNWDPRGAKKDRAMKALGDICRKAHEETADATRLQTLTRHTKKEPTNV